MWYCNGDLDNDCCMTFAVTVDCRGRISCTCPLCGALAEPADAEGVAYKEDEQEREETACFGTE